MKKYKRLIALMYSNTIRDCQSAYREPAHFTQTKHDNLQRQASSEITMVNMLFDGVMRFFPPSPKESDSGKCT